MKKTTNSIKNYFLVLPLLSSFVLIGFFFLILGVTFFPIIGIFVGLGVMYLGCGLANHILSDQAEVVGADMAVKRVIEPQVEVSVIQPRLVPTRVYTVPRFTCIDTTPVTALDHPLDLPIPPQVSAQPMDIRPI